eukprot:COSAG05_NODE_3259_length_2197_cov_302.607143_2_plen_97_part_00
MPKAGPLGSLTWLRVSVLAVQEERLKRLAEDEAAGRGPAAARKRRKKGQPGEAGSAAEAAMRALTEKKISTKVNYSVLQVRGLSAYRIARRAVHGI